MDNFIKIGMPVLVVLFLLVAAVSITMTVTRDNTLKQLAAASNTPVTNLETQLARDTQSATYAVSGQPGAAIPAQNTVSAAANNFSYDSDGDLASCHGVGTPTAGTTAGYSRGGCCGGKTGGNFSQPGGPVTGPTSGASCH